MLFKYLVALGASFLAFVNPLLAAVIALVFALSMLALVSTVAATAVWSRQAKRREDARHVLLVLLYFFFKPKK